MNGRWPLSSGNRCVQWGRVAAGPVRRGAPSVVDPGLSLQDLTGLIGRGGWPALLRALGRHCASEAPLSTLAADTGGSEGALDERTVSGYLRALERLMVIEDQPAWAPHLRSRARLRKAPKRHFVDPSLALAAVGFRSACCGIWRGSARCSNPW